jgi:hypothetical protein
MQKTRESRKPFRTAVKTIAFTAMLLASSCVMTQKKDTLPQRQVNDGEQVVTQGECLDQTTEEDRQELNSLIEKLNKDEQKK